MADQFVGRVVLGRAHRDADTGARKHLVPLHPEGIAQHGVDPVGDRDRVVLVAHPAHQDGELVAAHPGQQRLGAGAGGLAGEIVMTDGRLEAGTDLGDQGIAGCVAQAVVDELEAVQVDEDHAEPGPRIERELAERLVDLSQEVRSVGQVGQRVVQGVAQAVVGTVALDDPAQLGPRLPDHPRQNRVLRRRVGAEELQRRHHVGPDEQRHTERGAQTGRHCDLTAGEVFGRQQVFHPDGRGRVPDSAWQSLTWAENVSSRGSLELGQVQFGCAVPDVRRPHPLRRALAGDDEGVRRRPAGESAHVLQCGLQHLVG